ncbi:membrane fusion protein (multidrug efflux system) [Kaistia hirudinis]|uniref:Membrane fusion protein (Multidrug efflux system) n=1 Tax=Kaistia hirudinis TaxID=1293440 RepID=A0A840AR87_9HYPH|nr:efflux RND transporter periplasmic adaptor subunit [Kaistia hirudinis]MBB3931557.1 membrane fusion protein (multidrug efflux system) [Kaistia hirudinis]MBN9016193.1 efflux RND transporter periplasmic adaptor subunit [Hyphomicrobiales bacterium]
MKRTIIATIFLVLVAALCGLLIFMNVFFDKATAQFFANMKQPVVTISAEELKPTTWEPGIEAVGTVAAFQGVDIAVQAGGIVKQILFKANDRVKEGQLLVQIDDAVDRAGLLSAKTSVSVGQDALDRAQQLLDRKVGTIASLQDAQNNLDKAKGQLQQIEATVDQKAIKAPFAGTIGIPKIDVGQYVQPGTIVATLQDLDTMKVNFTVPEQRLASLKIGQPAKFGLDENNLNFTGEITGIDPKIDPASRLVTVQARVANADGTLRPGQFIHVRVQLPAEPNILAVPQTAVTISLYGTYVYVVDKAPPPPAAKEGEKPAEGAAAPAPAAGAAPDLVAKQVFVKTGRRSDGWIELLDGVKAGDMIVTSGQNKLSPGSPVAIDPSGTPPMGAVEKAGSVTP